MRKYKWHQRWMSVLISSPKSATKEMCGPRQITLPLLASESSSIKCESCVKWLLKSLLVLWDLCPGGESEGDRSPRAMCSGFYNKTQSGIILSFRSNYVLSFPRTPQHTIRKYNEEERKTSCCMQKADLPVVKGCVRWSLSLTISDYILIRRQILKPRSRRDKEQAIQCPSFGVLISLNLCTDNLLVILGVLPPRKHSKFSPAPPGFAPGPSRSFPHPARLGSGSAHLEPAPPLAAKPPASAGAGWRADRSASAAEPLVEVWPISHTFGVLIRRGWDFGKCAVDLGTSSNNAKLCYVKFN